MTSWWYVVGLRLDPATSAAEAAEVDAFYRDVHVPEVLAANPGFLRCLRFARTGRDLTGDPVPDRLACYQLDTQEGADAYLSRDGKPAYSRKPPAWQRTSPLWRAFWRGPDIGSTAGCERLVACGTDVPVAGGFSLYRDLAPGSAAPHVSIARLGPASSAPADPGPQPDIRRWRMWLSTLR